MGPADFALAVLNWIFWVAIIVIAIKLISEEW